MSDSEMLLAAAHAYGLHDAKIVPAPYTGQPTIYSDVMFDAEGSGYWNPRHSDEQAFRLAVKLRIDLDFDTLNPFVDAYRKERDGEALCSSEALTLDDNAATRLAITRAAAAIGEAMP